MASKLFVSESTQFALNNSGFVLDGDFTTGYPNNTTLTDILFILGIRVYFIRIGDSDNFQEWSYDQLVEEYGEDILEFFN